MPVEGYPDGDAPLFWVELRRPEKLNALDLDMWRGLEARLRGACRGPWALVALRGAGRAFCTGDDIGAMEALSTPEEAGEFFDALAGAVRAIVECGRPVAALVHGYAYGGCMEILLLLDVVVGVRGALLAAPEARLGLLAPLLSTLGPILLGRRALGLASTGRPISVEDALRYGIVDYVVDSVEEGEALLRRIASEAAASDPQAVALARRLSLESLPWERAWRALDELKKLVLNPRAKERMRAFLQRRARG